jgi:hypothetical protein
VGRLRPKRIWQKNRDLNVDSTKLKILDYLERRIILIAQNLTVIVGSAVASKLLGAAGGLEALTKMLACNSQCRQTIMTAHSLVFLVQRRKISPDSLLQQPRFVLVISNKLKYFKALLHL